jgi:GNAT superfamily N-acetyltransferase
MFRCPRLSPWRPEVPARVADVTGPDAFALADLRWVWRASDGDIDVDRAVFTTDFVAWARAHAETHIAYLYELDGQPVGMAWLAILPRIPGVDRWTRLSGHIQSVVVLATHRNRGLGESLMRFLLEDASRRGLDYVDVHPSTRSFPFYRRLGFGDSPRTLEVRPI